MSKKPNRLILALLFAALIICLGLLVWNSVRMGRDIAAGVQAAAPYDTDVAPEYGEQPVTLSACEYRARDGCFAAAGQIN